MQRESLAIIVAGMGVAMVLLAMTMGGTTFAYVSAAVGGLFAGVGCVQWRAARKR